MKGQLQAYTSLPNVAPITETIAYNQTDANLAAYWVATHQVPNGHNTPSLGIVEPLSISTTYYKGSYEKEN